MREEELIFVGMVMFYIFLILTFFEKKSEGWKLNIVFIRIDLLVSDCHSHHAEEWKCFHFQTNASFFLYFKVKLLSLSTFRNFYTLSNVQYGN